MINQEQMGRVSAPFLFWIYLTIKFTMAYPNR